MLFGSPVLDGGQAEYARIPMADSTLIHGARSLSALPLASRSTRLTKGDAAPSDVSDDNLILLCDILPTGFYCAQYVEPRRT